MSHELTSTIQEEESQEIEDSDEYENIEDKQSSLIRTSQLDHQTINESVDNKKSSLKFTEIPSIHSKLSKDKSSVKRPSNSSERSPRGSKQSYGTIRTSHLDQQSEDNRRPSLKSTEITLTHSKLSGDKISVKRPSNSSDRSPRGSKQSRDPA
ncbi:uncharacterized protein LOC130449839 [Diorhabda sublineata]|uniref:uncharacterized protein LOC130449839 n=1 Tax=Diorhabda sublineata TaxID=1163346 RepID=UPI0024E07717|nr:uncharacterized protein LOC130449839 [Diorhabda sublineata]